MECGLTSSNIITKHPGKASSKFQTVPEFRNLELRQLPPQSPQVLKLHWQELDGSNRFCQFWQVDIPGMQIARFMIELRNPLGEGLALMLGSSIVMPTNAPKSMRLSEEEMLGAGAGRRV